MPANRTTLLLMLLLFFATARAQQPLLQRQTILLKRVIEKNHYKPRPVNDAFSADVFDRMVEKLDPYKLYFTAKDITLLSAYRSKIDDEMNGQDWGFTDALTKLFKARQQKADSIANKLLDKPQAFTAIETFSYSKSQQPPQDDAEYALRWARFIKWRVLSKLTDKLEMGELDSIKLTKADVLKQEPAVRQGMKDRAKKRTAEQAKDPNATAKLIGTLYLQTIATNFDPHTEFLPPEEKADLQDAMSSQSSEYGFSLEEDEDGNLKVDDIKPGGAAWKSGNIHDDDKIIQIKPEGEAAIDVKEAGTEGVERVLKNHANTKMQVVVQSADGKVNTVNLQKQQQRNEENVVKGFVLHGSTKNVGYISLPSFYTDWGEEGGSSCANDVAKEIVKLKKENIEGLILDLRYNGGGSVQEAVELAGLFVDIGPMSLVRQKGGKTYILKDPNRGTIYDGPLELMINGQSASASELVAGTLQDYQRAAIVGSTSFGKATMQGIMPLDTTITEAMANNANTKMSDLGYVKTTVGKLFRITNKTAQLTGVVPDVALPDAFEAADYTERSLQFALPSDTIIKPVIYTKGKPVPTALAVQSSKRIGAEPYFTAIQKAVMAMKAVKDEDVVPLQWDAYQKWRKQGETPDEPEGKKKNDTKAPYAVQATAFDTELYKLDEYAKEVNDDRIEDLSDDPYLTEAYLVMLDYIQSTKP